VEEIKEIKEIFIPLCAALSAISAISAGHYYLMRIVFYCPTEIKEIKEIFIPLCEAVSAISALSAGHYYLMRTVFLLSRSHRLCRFARRRNKGNKENSSFGCCLRSAFGLKTSGSGTPET
ncbi:MAG: hypothetical protein SPL50_02525, partial [Alloprevotella sp.]|nr:hypothetical protein [Alloprevotella sp.]